MEALYEGGTHEPLTVVGSIKIPEMLSFLATHSTAGYVPGINNLLEGGYTLPDGSTALSADEKMVNGKKAITALADFRRAKEEGDEASMQIASSALKEYMPYFGYGYIQAKEDLVPHVKVCSSWSFRCDGGVRYVFHTVLPGLFYSSYGKSGWQNSTGCTGFPCGAFRWLTSPVRQDGLWRDGTSAWTIQDLLPVNAAVSKLETGSVQTTFFIFLIMFTVLLIADIGIR